MLIGVDLSMARKLYTSVPLSHIAKKTGEFPYFEKAVVLGAFVGGPLALLASFVFAVLAFGWWAVSAIPVSTVIYFVFQGSSSMPKQGMGGVTVVLALAIPALCLHWFLSDHIGWFAVLVALAFWNARPVCVTATYFLRAFVIRNRRAYDF